jgi:hypothetical protein
MIQLCMSYFLSEHVDIDFGSKAGLTEPREDYSVLADITWGS